jgi:hypothetical protein
MITHFKKTLYTTTTLILLILPILSVYAVGDPEQDKPSTFASQTKVIGLIKERLSRIYQNIGSWIRHEDPEWDSLFISPEKVRDLVDRDSFREDVNDMKISRLNHERLYERLNDFQDMVLRDILSPYEYEKGLRELESHDLERLFKVIRVNFQKKLGSFPSALNGFFKKDLLNFINHFCVRSACIENTPPDALPSMKELEELLTYYRGIQNPLDYTETLVWLKNLLKNDSVPFNLTDKQSMDLCRVIDVVRSKGDQQQINCLEAQQRLIQETFQELPFNGGEIPEEFNSSLLLPAKKEVIRKGEPSEPLSIKKAVKGLMYAAYKGVKHARKHPLRCLIGVFAGYATTAAAQSSDVFRIDRTGSSQWYSPIAIFGNNVFVVWGRASANDISGRIFLSNGTALTDEIYINQNQAPTTVYPDIAKVNGNAVVVWGGFINGNNISARLFSPAGIALTNDLDIYQNGAGYQRMPVVTDVGNNAFIAWYGSQTGDEDIYYRVVSPTGTPITNVLRLNQDITANQAYPAIANIGGNAFVLVLWRGDQTGDADVFGRLVFPNGTAPNNEFRINGNTTGTQAGASIASLNGNMFAVFHSSQPGGNYDIVGRLLSPDGTPMSGELPISQATGVEHSASIVIINGRAFVSWQGSQEGAWHVYGRSIDPVEFFPSTTRSTTSSDTTTTSNIPPFTSLTSVSSSIRSQTTTKISSTLSSLSLTPQVTEKKNSRKTIWIGTGIAGTSLVALTAGGIAAKKYRLSKKGKGDPDSSPDKDTGSLEGTFTGYSNDSTTIYGLASSVRPPGTEYANTPNGCREDTYANAPNGFRDSACAGTEDAIYANAPSGFRDSAYV